MFVSERFRDIREDLPKPEKADDWDRYSNKHVLLPRPCDLQIAQKLKNQREHSFSLVDLDSPYSLFRN